MSSLSVIIITKNAQQTITACLESVKWANEIIILDSGSSDQTCSLCKRYTPHVYQTDWPGYGPQKQRALAKATQKWVLSLDADEVLSTALQTAIQAAIQTSDFSGYQLPRKLVFQDKVIHYANGSTYQLRLFQRDCTHNDGKMVHESFIVSGQVGYMQQPFYHYSFLTIDQFIDKMNHYTSLKAEHVMAKRKSSVIQAIIHGLAMFIRVYVIQRGFLDGNAGFVLAAGFAQQSYYCYIKACFPGQSAIDAAPIDR